jgi:hypothetical protein
MVEGRILAVAAVIAAIAAPAAAGDPALGSSVQKNIVAHVVDLHPAYAGVKIEGGNGVRSEAAMNRYLDGRVTPLRSISGEAQVGANPIQRGAGGAAPATSGPR